MSKNVNYLKFERPNGTYFNIGDKHYFQPKDKYYTFEVSIATYQNEFVKACKGEKVAIIEMEDNI